MDGKYKDVGEIEDRVIEELGEVIQAISKARRFGYFNWHPDRPVSNNLSEILDEIKDAERLLKSYKKSLKLVFDNTLDGQIAELRKITAMSRFKQPLR